MGINKVYFQAHKSVILNIVWPEEDRIPSIPLPHQPFYIQTWPFELEMIKPLFDEGSGRIVSSTVDDGFKMLDFDFSRHSRNQAV